MQVYFIQEVKPMSDDFDDEDDIIPDDDTTDYPDYY
jgi:hypothetical protein